MESFNLREIRNQLPLGAIADIARSMRIEPSVVTAIFKGRRSKYTDEVVSHALEIIESKKASPELLKKAKGLKLTSLHITPFHRPGRRKSSHSGGIFKKNKPVWIGIAIAGAIGLFLWFRAKQKAGGLL